MKWTDANIDKLFQEKAEELTFEFNESYLDDFHDAQTVGNTDQVDSTSNTDIDKMYQGTSGKMQFEYNDGYWQEFIAMMPGLEHVDLDSNTDIDRLYQDATDKVDIEYNDGYWQEFNEGLEQPHRVDELYQNESAELAFEYKESYWNEMLGILDRRRRPDFLWFGLAVLFLGLLTTTTFLHNPQLVMNEQTEILGEITQENTEEQSSEATTSNNSLSDNAVESELDKFNETPNTEIGLDRVSNVDRMNVVGAETNLKDQYNNTVNEVGSGVSDITSKTNDSNHSENRSVVDVTDLNNEKINASNTNIAVDDRNSIISGDANDHTNEEVNEQNLNVGEESDNSELVSKESFEIGDLATRNLTAIVIDKNLINVPVDLKLSDGPKPPMSARLYIEANGGMSQSLITPSDNYSYSIGGGLGVQLDKGRWCVNIGANAIWNFHDDLVLNGEAKVYGFGSDVYRYTLKYDEIYTLEGVISAGYRFGNSRINLGVRPSYLLNAKVGFTLAEEEIETDRQTSYGYTEGLNRFGLKATLGYSLDLKGGFLIGANIGTRLLKSVNEGYLNGTNNTLPFDGQIYIRKLIKFRR